MSANVLRIGQLHYHFRRCGVRTVIENLVRGGIAYGPFERVEWDLMSCDAQQEPGRELVRSVQVFAQQQGKEGIVHPIELSELDYQMEPAANREQLFAEAADLANRIAGSMQLDRHTKENPYVLHVHNANLGKNPRLTLALKLLADRLEAQDLPAWILYQMHDFAEDHRPDNWKSLCNVSGTYDRSLAVEIMYPTSSRVLWACINSADREKLISIGLNPDSISILPNSIDVETFSAPPLMSMSETELNKLQLTRRNFAGDLKKRIGEYARQNHFEFDPNRKLLLAPIKTLRRKNVIESVLLLTALNQQRDTYQLVTTLPAASTADLEYSHAIETVVKRNHLPVVMGIGEELLAGINHRVIESGQIKRYALIDLLSLSEAVITTSVQEGFGYVFHEPWLAGKPVLGRNLPHVTRDFIDAGMQLEHLYDHLVLPWTLIQDQWPDIVKAYQKKIITLRNAAGLKPIPEKNLHNQINQNKTYKRYNQNEAEEIFADWADLPWRSQLALLQQVIADPTCFQRILWLNYQTNPTSNWFQPDISDIIKQNQLVITNQYRIAKVIETFGRLITKGNRQIDRKRESWKNRLSNEAVFAVSLEPENIRLLD